MLKRVKQAVSIFKSRGIASLIFETSVYFYRHFFRKITPKIGYSEYALGIDYAPIIIEKDERYLDKFFYRNSHYAYNLNKELGLRLGHIALTRLNDHVVIIGGGEGITAITAGKQVGKNGKLTIYDGLSGNENVYFGTEKIKNNLKLNDIPEIYNLVQAIVTTEKDHENIYPNEKIVAKIIHPKDLPNCDVLETDCNGAELIILKNMKIKPRSMIIEIEAPFYKSLYKNGEHPRDTVKLIKDLGYKIVKMTGHEGIVLNDKEFFELIDIQYEANTKKILKNGAKHSPIVYATLEN